MSYNVAQPTHCPLRTICTLTSRVFTPNLPGAIEEAVWERKRYTPHSQPPLYFFHFISFLTELQCGLHPLYTRLELAVRKPNKEWDSWEHQGETRNHKTSLLNNSDAGQEVSVGQLLPELHTLWVLGLFLINVINSSAKHRQACTAKPQKITWAHEKGTHTVQLKLKNILML